MMLLLLCFLGNQIQPTIVVTRMTLIASATESYWFDVTHHFQKKILLKNAFERYYKVMKSYKIVHICMANGMCQQNFMRKMEIALFLSWAKAQIKSFFFPFFEIDKFFCSFSTHSTNTSHCQTLFQSFCHNSLKRFLCTIPNRGNCSNSNNPLSFK